MLNLGNWKAKKIWVYVDLPTAKIPLENPTKHF